MINWTEAPREAMQSKQRIVPSAEKVMYLQLLLNAGFSILDVGSIVSPKLVPQMADTPAVVDALELRGTDTRLMVLVVNLKGTELMVKNEKVSYLSYPFSISETFQKKNLNQSMDQAKELLKQMQDLCKQNGKELIVYLSMAFGNPYGDKWDNEIVLENIDFLKNLGVCTVKLSNVSLPVNEEIVGAVFRAVIPFFPNLEIGLHLHTNQSNWYSQVEVAWEAGCRNFDTVMSGFGGCPMSDELIGNLDTDLLLKFFNSKGIETGIDTDVLSEARSMAAMLFPY